MIKIQIQGIETKNFLILLPEPWKGLYLSSNIIIILGNFASAERC